MTPSARPGWDDRGDWRLVRTPGRGNGAESSSPLTLHPAAFLALLPHRGLPDLAVHRVTDGTVTLLLQPGYRSRRDGSGFRVGVPSGAVARLVLLYLQAEALRAGSRAVELGGRMEAWFRGSGWTPDAEPYPLVRDQVERIARARFALQIEWGDALVVRDATVADGADLSDDHQTDAWWQSGAQGAVLLSRDFLAVVQRYAVPLPLGALRRLRTCPLALDLYSWLAYRLHSLGRTTPVGWAALHAWFGSGHDGRAAFEEAFGQALQDVLACYPEAASCGAVERTADGLLLRRALPPGPDRARAPAPLPD